jgi:hypothetical protein
MKLIIFWWIAVILDYYSTIILTWHSEENPYVQYIWKNYGDFGFTVFNILGGIFVSLIIYWVRNIKGRNIIYTAFAVLVLFKILIALTNLGIAPYSWTSWFQY